MTRATHFTKYTLMVTDFFGVVTLWQTLGGEDSRTDIPCLHQITSGPVYSKDAVHKTHFFTSV